jgi:hypothetical protein
MYYTPFEACLPPADDKQQDGAKIQVFLKLTDQKQKKMGETPAIL